MDIHNFKCPICLEIYCDAHKPCVLTCGHSCCIEHVKNIQTCAICKCEIKDKSFKEAIFLKDMAVEYVMMHKTTYVDEYNYIVTKMTELKIRDCDKKITEINQALFEIETELVHLTCKVSQLEDKKSRTIIVLQQYIDEKN